MDNIQAIYSKFFFPIQYHINSNTIKRLEARLETGKLGKGAPPKPVELKRMVLQALMINQINRQESKDHNILRGKTKNIRTSIQSNGNIVGMAMEPITDADAIRTYNNFYNRSFGTKHEQNFQFIEQHVNLRAYSQEYYQKKYSDQFHDLSDRELKEEINLQNRKRLTELLREISKGRKTISKEGISLTTPSQE